MARNSTTQQAEYEDIEQYPRLWNLSLGMLSPAVVRPAGPRLPTEYIYVPLTGMKRYEALGRISQWNLSWESAQLRGRLRHLVHSLPKTVRPIVRLRDDINVTFIPRDGAHRYHAYAPLFHLLPVRSVRRHALPLLHRGSWPSMMPPEEVIPGDFDERLSRAFAGHVWHHLLPGSPIAAFSRDDPIKLLAHNLDYWLGPMTELIQDWLHDFGRAPADPDEAAKIEKARANLEPSVLVDRPLRGGDLWRGEDEANEATAALVERADADGKLRGILDAVRRNRVEDDFSERWSYEREDFERRLYRKRNKVKVRFVELTDTIPVHGPESEVENKLLFEDFIALLDARERDVVVLLRSGVTRVGEIASRLGYANHSPVSKKLRRIREKAAAFFKD